MGLILRFVQFVHTYRIEKQPWKVDTWHMIASESFNATSLYCLLVFYIFFNVCEVYSPLSLFNPRDNFPAGMNERQRD